VFLVLLEASSCHLLVRPLFPAQPAHLEIAFHLLQPVQLCRQRVQVFPVELCPPVLPEAVLALAVST
jgi:hypothetical protein